MFSFNPQVKSPEIVLEKHLSVKAAAETSGYSIQCGPRASLEAQANNVNEALSTNVNVPRQRM